METVIGIPFVEHVDQNLRPEIHNPKNYLKSMFDNRYHGNLPNIHTFGAIKIMGYRYDFKKYLKQYVVKQHGGWQEYYAPNKTLLRKTLFGKVEKIIEIK